MKQEMKLKKFERAEKLERKKCQLCGEGIKSDDGSESHVRSVTLSELRDHLNLTEKLEGAAIQLRNSNFKTGQTAYLPVPFHILSNSESHSIMKTLLGNSSSNIFRKLLATTIEFFFSIIRCAIFYIQLNFQSLGQIN